MGKENFYKHDRRDGKEGILQQGRQGKDARKETFEIELSAGTDLARAPALEIHQQLGWQINITAPCKPTFSFHFPRKPDQLVC